MNKGFTLVEVLVSAGLLAVIALGVGTNIITTFMVHKTVLVNEALNDLATEKIETYSSVNPLEMDDSNYDDSEPDGGNTLTVGYLSNNITFSRSTDVVVNADDSRSIIVNVTCLHPLFSGKSVTKTTTFMRW